MCSFWFVEYRYIGIVIYVQLLNTSKLLSKKLGTNWILGFPPLLLANMDALLSKLMEIMDGLSLQASPSTCIGMVLVVTILADWHWQMVVPWPPACSRGCKTNKMSGIHTNILCAKWLQTFKGLTLIQIYQIFKN